MPEITDLKKLLKYMKPKLVKGEFVFCTVSEEELKKINIKPLLVFREDEGVTITIEKKIADSYSFSYSNIWALITLTVHSGLEAIGFLAEITKKFAQNGISVNVVSAFYHDHLFVPIKQKKKAIKLLKELSK